MCHDKMTSGNHQMNVGSSTRARLMRAEIFLFAQNDNGFIAAYRAV
jgi:hypothetical protein